MAKKLTPLRRIRLKCLDCSADSAHEVRLCPIDDCTLWPLRFGKNPARAGKGNTRGVEALKRYRESRVQKKEG